MASFKIGKMIMRSLFEKPATLMYPVIPREWEERTRGQISISETECITCGICARKCPTNAITVDREISTWGIQRMQCIQCGCCVEVCPKKCLHMEKAYTSPDTEKITDTFQVPKKEKPAKPEGKGKAAKASGGDEGELSCDKEQCVYCGLCVKECPAEAITVDRKEKKWEVDKDACVKCGACVDKCPKKCLTL